MRSALLPDVLEEPTALLRMVARSNPDLRAGHIVICRVRGKQLWPEFLNFARKNP
jgi:hypothetical protein